MSYLNDLFSLEGNVAVAIGAGGVLAGAMADALGAAGARVAVLERSARLPASRPSAWRSTPPARRISARPSARS
jgi:NAD(P)-dependent dehydrogenase (short-subunit alcohol dehydrogenase family)